MGSARKCSETLKFCHFCQASDSNPEMMARSADRDAGERGVMIIHGLFFFLLLSPAMLEVRKKLILFSTWLTGLLGFSGDAI